MESTLRPVRYVLDIKWVSLGITEQRALEAAVAILISNATMFYTTCVFSCSVVSRLFVTPWTLASQAPLSKEFSRQEYWSGLGCHFLLQGTFLTQGLNLSLLHLLHWQADCLPGKPNKCILNFANEMGLLQIFKNIEIDVYPWNTLTSREYVT